MSRNKPIEYLAIAVMANVIAILYLYVIDLRIIQYAQLSWDSELGYVMLIPFIFMIAYSWVCLLLCIRFNILYSQVWTGDEQWTPQVVKWEAKHASIIPFI